MKVSVDVKISQPSDIIYVNLNEQTEKGLYRIYKEKTYPLNPPSSMGWIRISVDGNAISDRRIIQVFAYKVLDADKQQIIRTGKWSGPSTSLYSIPCIELESCTSESA